MDTALRTHVAPRSKLVLSSAQRFALAANAVGLLCVLTLLFTVQPSSAVMRVGQVAGETVVAQRSVTYVDRVATAAKRKAVAEGVATVYRIDLTRAQQERQQASRFLEQAAAVIGGSAPPAQRLVTLRKLLPADTSPAALQELATLSLSDFRVVQQRSLTLLSEALAWRFDSHEVTATELALLSTVPAQVTLAQRTAIGEVLSTFLAPTLVTDIPATEAKQRQAASKVTPVVNTIYAGQVIVRRGDLVTPTIVNELSALGLQSRRESWQQIAGSLLFAATVIAILLWYLHAFQPDIASNPRLLLLIDACIVIAVAGARLLADGHVVLPYFLPVATASTFAAVLMAPEACIAVTLAMAVLAGWVVANSFELTMYYFLTGAAGIIAIRQIKQLRQFILAGIAIGLFALLTLLAFGLVDRTYDLAAIQDYLLASAFNGFTSSALALGGFTLLASYFGVTTSLHLLELAQPNQPLLRRLMVRAPGTYNHSLILATMVERAAEDIGCDSLVAKLGALYHDVGKTANPHCFVENQMGMSNIHDELRPEESARIIRGHVPQGLRLARQYHLPRVILDAIAEHHGTMSIAYFLNKAQRENPDAWVDPTLYTYPGPRPRSKETALLMLADGCESTVRAASDHSEGKIREIVERIIAERIAQGQLDDCPLTIHDLESAKVAFCAVLNGLYHPRVEYPEPVLERIPEAPVALSDVQPFERA